VRRRYCKDVVIVSKLFSKAREGEGGPVGLKREAREEMGDCEDFFIAVRTWRKR